MEYAKLSETPADIMVPADSLAFAIEKLGKRIHALREAMLLPARPKPDLPMTATNSRIAQVLMDSKRLVQDLTTEVEDISLAIDEINTIAGQLD
jgi:hypothetical protein